MLGFNGLAQPDQFVVRVDGTRQRRTVNIFENRTSREKQLDITRPLIPLLNGLLEGFDASTGSVRALSGKLSGGPGAYHGLWALLEETYVALSTGAQPPITPRHIRAVTALVNDLAQTCVVA